jgi:hypothetical protein
VTPTAANPTGVQNGIEHRFERSKERARFKKRVQKTTRRQRRQKDKKTKVADERKIRHDFSDTTFQTQLLDTAFRNEE